MILTLALAVWMVWALAMVLRTDTDKLNAVRRPAA